MITFLYCTPRLANSSSRTVCVQIRPEDLFGHVRWQVGPICREISDVVTCYQTYNSASALTRLDRQGWLGSSFCLGVKRLPLQTAVPL